jgi:hypothetical protein
MEAARLRDCAMRKRHAAAVWSGPVEWEQCVALIAVVAGCLARQQWAYCKKHLSCTATRASATRHRHL